MRILINGLNFTPELTGIGKYTGEMAAFLAEQGHDVRVITSPPYYPYWQVQSPYHAWRYQIEKWQGVKVIRCPLWVPEKPTGVKRLIHLFSFMLSSFPAILFQGAWKSDVVITIAPALFSTIPSLLLGKLTGVKTLLHIQDFEVDAAFKLGLLSNNSWLYQSIKGLERILLTSFDRVSTISSQMIKKLLDIGVEIERTILVPNWIDTDAIYPLSDSNPYRDEWAISDDQLVILYSGNMGEKQGLEIVIEVARKCINFPELVFLLCGDGNVLTQLKAAANDLPNVHFYPLQPLERLNELLNLADIHILPQRADAADLVMPSKLSGMLSSGKVVVATAWPESNIGMVVEKIGVLVPPADAAMLAEAILFLANDTSLRLQLGSAGREWAIHNWKKGEILNNLEAHLSSLIANEYFRDIPQF